MLLSQSLEAMALDDEFPAAGVIENVIDSTQESYLSCEDDYVRDDGGLNTQ